MEDIVENEKKVTAYYKVEESFIVETAEGGEKWINREIIFKDGPMLELRSNALNYCRNRMNEIDARCESPVPAPETEMAAYRDPGLDWVPLPSFIDSYDLIEVYCLLIIEEGGSSRRKLLFSIQPDSLIIDNLSDEADFLLYNA